MKKHSMPDRDGHVRPKIRRAGLIALVLVVIYFLASQSLLIHRLEGDVRDALQAQVAAEDARSADATRFQHQLGDLQTQLDKANADLQTALTEVTALKDQLERLGIEPDLPPEAKQSSSSGGDIGPTSSPSDEGRPRPSSPDTAGPTTSGESSPAPPPAPEQPAPEPQPEPEPEPEPDPLVCVPLLNVCI